MSTILRADPARPRALCAGCQVGQGRQCACRAAKPRKRRELSPTEATWLVLLLDVACLLAVVVLVRWAL